MVQLIPLLVILPFLIFWMWMFWEMTRNDYLPENEKFTWMLMFIFLNIFAAGMYYFNEYRRQND